MIRDRLNWILLTISLTSIMTAIAEQPSLPLWETNTPYAKPGDQELNTPRIDIYHAPNGNGAAVVVCPGGGYGGLAKDHEGHQVAKWYNKHGVSAYVLTYRLGSQGHHFPTQLADVQRAIRLVRAHSKEWNIDSKRIGVMGFSAGGHLASMAATKFDEKAYESVDPIDDQSARPDFAVLCYPVISMNSDFTHKGSRRNLLGQEKSTDPEAMKQVSSELNITTNTPPTFLFHTDEDKAVPPQNSIVFYLGLKKHNIPSELHLYQSGPHGVGLFEGDPILGTWSSHLAHWLRNNGYFTNEVERVSVSGTAELDGQPVSWGTVTFHPEDKNLPIVTARIRRGKFSAKKEQGPPTGKCHITFTGSIWEATGNASDELVKLNSLKPNGDPILVDLKEGSKFDWKFSSN